MSFSLLQQLCTTRAPSGEESLIKDFIVQYVQGNCHNWRVQPEIIAGDFIQDCLILRFGTPRTSVFAHLDTVGFTVRYQDQLVPIGSPEVKNGYQLVGEDAWGPVRCSLKLISHAENEQQTLHYQFGRGIISGTSLVFEGNFQVDDSYLSSCSLDNRLSVYVLLKMAETLENGLIVFSCQEELGGGTVPNLLDFIMKHYPVHQCLVADATEVAQDVQLGKGIVLGIPGRRIPYSSFAEKVLHWTRHLSIPYQLAYENRGSHDGREIQQSPYSLDWCLVGIPVARLHTPCELVHQQDIISYLGIYQYLMRNL